jgi:hypothetical protein
MSYQDETLRELTALGVLDALRWAAASASARALSDYSEPAGYNATTLGTDRHHLLVDRIDRVFSLGKYFIPSGEDSGAGLDLVFIELTPTRH